MKNIPTIAGALLGLLFLFASVTYLFDLFEPPPAPPEGTPMAHFSAAVMATGYMTFVKVCELIGAVLVAIPRTRAFGLLLLAPVVANIFAFHWYVVGGGFDQPLVIAALALTVLVLICEIPNLLDLLHKKKG